MKVESRVENFQKEMEAVFMECEKNISKAIKEYERDIYGALELVKRDCIKRTKAA